MQNMYTISRPSNHALTITAVTTTLYMKIMAVTPISPVFHLPPGQQFSTNRLSPPMRWKGDLRVLILKNSIKTTL